MTLWDLWLNYGPEDLPYELFISSSPAHRQMCYIIGDFLSFLWSHLYTGEMEAFGHVLDIHFLNSDYISVPVPWEVDTSRLLQPGVPFSVPGAPEGTHGVLGSAS